MNNFKREFKGAGDYNTGFSFCSNDYKDSSSKFPFDYKFKDNSIKVNLSFRKNFNEDLSRDEEEKVYKKLNTFNGFERLRQIPV